MVTNGNACNNHFLKSYIKRLGGTDEYHCICQIGYKYGFEILNIYNRITLVFFPVIGFTVFFLKMSGMVTDGRSLWHFIPVSKGLGILQ